MPNNGVPEGLAVAWNNDIGVRLTIFLVLEKLPQIQHDLPD